MPAPQLVFNEWKKKLNIFFFFLLFVALYLPRFRCQTALFISFISHIFGGFWLEHKRCPPFIASHFIPLLKKCAPDLFFFLS